MAHRLARVLRGAAAVTACRRHDAHTHQSTTMRCSVQRSDRATGGRRSRRVCPAARRPWCRPVPRAPWRVETGHTVRSIGVVHVPSASLGGAAPPSKTARRPPCVCRAVRRQLCRALMPLAWSLWHLLPMTSKQSSQPPRARGATPAGAAAVCTRSPNDRATTARGGVPGTAAQAVACTDSGL